MPSLPRMVGRVAGLALCFALATSASMLAPLAHAATPRVHALTNAKVVVAPGQVLPRATIVLRDGVIEAVGVDVAIPPDARVWDAESLVVYPGLIDAYVRRSKLQGREAPPSFDEVESIEAARPGAVQPIARVHPEFDLTRQLNLGGEAWAPYQSLGFTAGYVVPDSGIFRGEGALLSMRAGRVDRLAIGSSSMQCLGYDTGRGADGYPRSLMGVVSLMRQTFLDAQQHREAKRIYSAAPRGQERPSEDASLDALASVVAGSEAVLFETTDVLSVDRSSRIAREFGLKPVLRGSGDEYKRINLVQEASAPLILPIAFPDPPALGAPEDDRDVSMQALRAWDRAPSNPAKLEKAGVAFAITADLLNDPSLFWSKLRVALSRGLSKEAALRALTTEPARILGVSDRLGTIEVGKIANLTITDGDLFARGTHVRRLFVDGDPIAMPASPKDAEDVRGLWRLEHLDGSGHGAGLGIRGEADSLTATFSPGAASLAGGFKADSVKASNDSLWIRWPGRPPLKPEILSLRAALADEKQGTMTDDRGTLHAVRAERRVGPPPSDKQETLPEPETAASVVPGPLATPKSVLFQHANLWTCATAGLLKNSDLLVQDGKIAAIGAGLAAPSGAMVVDASGLDLSPGVIDCHSHTAGVGDINEGTLSSSAMVRLGDIVNSESKTIYEQLAGGVIAVNMLHGSANCIGGQSQVLKLRWGADPEDLKWKEARPGIKFALGENVTQKSWGEKFVKRYPKSRMGVEQFDLERFTLARDYESRWKEYNALSTAAKAHTIPPRRDLELDCLVEILNGQRDVHCHSYRQDEILMLMRLAERLGFRIACFQHILEGYKVADEMAKHGAAASAFSDWWTYKPEVYDAIPFAGAILRAHGVTVSFNSDSSELARRLNLEAAKAVKYGAVPEMDALEFVTLNPAKQLGLERRAGSLEVGKDADVALWSGSPLSTGSICVQTWIDGQKYFDRKVDLESRPKLAAERASLLAKARRFAEGDDGGGPHQGPPHKMSYEINDGLAHCMPNEEEVSE
ncbi:MAG: amidohydrolase family protein [Candidatus Eisenbacteria bacterium]